MEALPQQGTVCSTCGVPLSTDGSCLACMMRGGMEETAADAPDTPPPPPPAAPPVYGDFEVARRPDGSPWELGRGAMGVTYRAVDRVLHRQVALKVINVAGRAGHVEALRERFLREARAAAALRHQNVAGIFQFGTADKSTSCYYAMELVEGETLEARVRRDGPLDVPAALEVARQVCAALAAAAARGLIHRDLKPGNLMLATGGGSGGVPAELEVKVIDFGLAKAAAASIGEADLTHGGFVGTPAFASPEQFARGAVDARSDLYSLGLTLWYALTGKVPFTGRTLEELRDDPARTELPVAQLAARGVPAGVVALLRRVLALDPAARPASARDLLDALDACRRKLGENQVRRRWAVTAAAIGVLAATGGTWRWTHPPAAPVQNTAAIRPQTPPALVPPTVPEKSLAVLPFDNFSQDKDSAFFADGVQDEVLTDLSKVADLTVISRSSVMQYKKDEPRNLKEIGRTLGVAYVVEGSVQRAGNKIKVVAQLIDARTDAHRWAETYVRDLSDVFAIQSEIAQTIAGQLKAAVSPKEQAEIEDVPTHDEQAYQLYLRALAVWNDGDRDSFSTGGAMELLRQATARDPNFTRAFVLMTRMQCVVYYTSEHLPANETLFHALAETVARLRPGSADANLAMGLYDYYSRNDYPRAHDEFAEALRQAPNDSWAYDHLGMIERHHAQWDESAAHLRRALELDPENTQCFFNYVCLLETLGRHPEAVALTDRRIAAHPTQHWLHACKASLLLQWKADTRGARAELALLPPESKADEWYTYLRLECDLMERDFAAAARDLAASTADSIYDRTRSGYEGDIARYRGDAKTAARAYTTFRSEMEQATRADPKDPDALIALARADALLGHQEAAREEIRRALPLIPDDTLNAPLFLARRVKVLILLGERDEAIRALQTLCAKPFGPSYGLLHAEPDWDPLRSDPRFQAIEASLAPK